MRQPVASGRQRERSSRGRNEHREVLRRAACLGARRRRLIGGSILWRLRLGCGCAAHSMIL